MRKLIIFSILIFIKLSCVERPRENDETNSGNLISDCSADNSILSENYTKISELPKDNELSIRLSNIFSEIVKAYPDDSASLYRFYYVWFHTTENNKIRKQIERIEKLLTETNKQRYHNVEQNLKPLLKRIVADNSVNNSKLDNLVTLYSDYDYFSGEGLLSHLLTNEENYQLSWKTFETIAEQSQRDTTNIAALIELDKRIKTNAELAGEFFAFVEKAIINNPHGFLDMYSNRNNKLRDELMNYLQPSTNFSKEIVLILNNISHNTSDERHRKVSLEILNTIKERKI